jgi:hypothetical protein
MSSRLVLPAFALLAACGGTTASVDSSPDSGATGADAATSSDATTGTTSDASSDATLRDAGVDAPDVQRDGGTEGCNGRSPIPPGYKLPDSTTCGFPGEDAGFPVFDKCCAVETDCIMVTYQYSCCGDLYTFGINRDESDPARLAANAWHCAQCGCPNGGNHTEDGLTASFPTVSCDNGYCMTHGQH